MYEMNLKDISRGDRAYFTINFSMCLELFIELILEAKDTSVSIQFNTTYWKFLPVDWTQISMGYGVPEELEEF